MNRTGSKTRMADWPREQTCLVRKDCTPLPQINLFWGAAGRAVPCGTSFPDWDCTLAPCIGSSES